MNGEIMKVDTSVPQDPPLADVEFTFMMGWPKVKCIATTKIQGKTISQVGIGRSNHYGTVLAKQHAQEAAFTGLKLAVAIAKHTLEAQEPPKETSSIIVEGK